MDIVNRYKHQIPEKVIEEFLSWHNEYGDMILEKVRPADPDSELDWDVCRTNILAVGVSECSSIEEYVLVIRFIKELGVGNYFIFTIVSSAIKKLCKTDDEMIKYFELCNNIIPFKKYFSLTEVFDEEIDDVGLSMKMILYFDNFLGSGDGKFIEYAKKFNLLKK